MTTQSWKWDAEAAFKRIERHAENKPKFVECGRTFGKSDRPYTPPPNVAAWLKAQADKPKPHGRDIESLMRYHEAHKKPVGYWEDAPRGMKFGGGGRNSVSADVQKPNAAPTTTPPADGPWPKYALSPSHDRKGLSVVYIQAEAGGMTTAYYTDGTKMTHRASNGVLAFGAICTDIGVIIRALEQNGHADVAAQLRGKDATSPRDDVATGARAWKWKGVQRCPNGCYVDVGGVMYYKESETFWRRSCAQNADRADAARHIELHGPERDAIVAECRKAMGI